jgi:hypothetical protein
LRVVQAGEEEERKERRAKMEGGESGKRKKVREMELVRYLQHSWRHMYSNRETQ